MKNKSITKKVLLAFLSVLIAVVVLPAMLTLTALIPQSALRENMTKTGEYLREWYQIYPLYPGLDTSIYDHYADSILLSIAWQYDSENPVPSVAESSYYISKNVPIYAALLESVQEDLDGNQEYIRYWHGSNLFLRPLLLILNLKEIYILNGVLLGVLFIWLLARLVHNNEYALAAALFIAALATASYFVPISLEYVPTYYIWLISCHVLLTLEGCGKTENLWFFFLIVGVFTSFADFLTTETLTLTVPLLMLLYMQKKHSAAENKSLLLQAGRYTVFWASGYVGMWAYKWLYASIVLKINALDYVRDNVSERLGGIDSGLSLSGATAAIGNNLKILLTGSKDRSVSPVIVVFALLVFAAALYVYHKKNPDFRFMGVMAVFALVPYLRYAVLQNHSAIHYFFTFRAQLVTIMALMLIFIEVIEWRLGGKKHGSSGKRKS